MDPERLAAPSEEAPIPSYQVLDYYSRATGEFRLDGNLARDAPEQELSPELSGQLYDGHHRHGAAAQEGLPRWCTIKVGTYSMGSPKSEKCREHGEYWRGG